MQTERIEITAEAILPSIVAIAAPITPSFGKNSRPLMRTALKTRFTALADKLVVMEMRVFPHPRCAALIISEMTVKFIPTIQMRKYGMASSIVSSCAPANRRSGLDTAKAITVKITHRPNASGRTIARQRFAPS